MTQNRSKPLEQWQTKFAELLAQLVKAEKLATLAQLRRGLGKKFGEESRRDGWVLSQLRQLPIDRNRDDFVFTVEHCCLIASLFALHRQSRSRDSLGTAFRKMAAQLGVSEEAVERRFHVLLDTDPEDLPERLRHAISLLKSKDIGLDWGRLLNDISNWTRPSRSVQKNWSTDFWAPRPRSTEEDDSTDDTLATSDTSAD